MTHSDILYFKLCHKFGIVRSPFLEIGAAKVQKILPNLCELAKQVNIDEVKGADLSLSEGVDIQFDFAIDTIDFAKTWSHGKFSTVAIFNVLEHTFDPITVLRNALSCVAPGGALLVVVPCIWPLHDYPFDFLRINPHWHEEFAKRFSLKLYPDLFCYLSQFGIIKIDESRQGNGYEYHTFHNVVKSKSPFKYWRSRVIHFIFNTYGRGHGFTHLAIGAAFIC